MRLKRSEELKRKPVFLFVQGSLPTPIILYDEKGAFPMLPFETDTLLARYHLLVISKPGLPLTADLKTLTPNHEYLAPRTGQVPLAYCQRNYLGYLARQPWVDACNMTAMSLLEDSNVVVRLARHPGPLRHVVYLSGSHLGHTLTVIAGNRQEADSVGAENNFKYWQEVVAAPKQNNCLGDPHPLVPSLSSTQTPLGDFRHSRLPVFVGYGTHDRSALPEDYMRLEIIRAGKTNLTFRAYPELEHNFFGFTNGEVDYKKWNWDRMATTFLRGCRPPGNLRAE